MERTVSLQRNSLMVGHPPASPLFGAEPEDDDGDVQEVEMVLETYFMHIDNTYNKLQTLTEYIDDTEVDSRSYLLSNTFYIYVYVFSPLYSTELSSATENAAHKLL